MKSGNVLILERSSENLKKLTDKGKIVLEGVFAEFGRENRNGRVYEEKEYLPHLEYLKKDMANGSLLGELDHPERFEIALGNVSHRVTELWYDQSNRQIRGKIEILDGTPKGQVVKALLEAGVPLSISSRAAGTVNDDKTVEIQQIYTYDLVAKPGFEAAQLHSVNENMKPIIQQKIQMLNESHDKFDEKYNEISEDLGIVNENVSIYDVSNKFPAITLRDEALEILNERSDDKNNQEYDMKDQISEESLQQWTVYFKNQLSKINERLSNLEGSAVNGKVDGKELKGIKSYVEKLRSIQENALDWQGDIAKSVNKLATYTNKLAEKSNGHYAMTNSIKETVDHNAEALNKTQDWVGENAKVTNAVAETVDHNAQMQNDMNEWQEEMSKAVNALNEWGEEKAKAINAMYEWGQEKAQAINGLHEWTGSVAKGVNQTATYAEEMFGRGLSKKDAQKLLEYIDLMGQAKKNPELKESLKKALKTNSITGKPLKESMPKGLDTITDVTTVKGTKYDDKNLGQESGAKFDEKSKTIVQKMKKTKFKAGKKPKELDSKDEYVPKQEFKKSENVSPSKQKGDKGKGIMTLDIHSNHKTKPNKPAVKVKGEGGPSNNMQKKQNMKLNTKPGGKGFNESVDLSKRSNRLDEKLSKIITNVEKEKTVVNETRKAYPFAGLLGENDVREFAGLSKTDKQRVAEEVAKHPTNDSNVIKKLWETALADKDGKNSEPLWLKAAPKEYRKKYEDANEQLKESIKARAEFYDLNTQYQIDNFWQTSGLIQNKVPKLNETIAASGGTKKSEEGGLNIFVSTIGEQMKRYNQ